MTLPVTALGDNYIKLFYDRTHKWKRAMRKSTFILLALAGIITTSFAAIWIFNDLVGTNPHSHPLEVKRDRAEILAACQQHVREADRKATEAVTKRAADFYSFIQSRRVGAMPFSKDVVSLQGKWRAVKPYLPFTDSEGHKEFVEEKFGQHIFTNDTLATQLKLAIESSIKDIESIENELAVAMRREVLGSSPAPDEIPFATEWFKKAIERIVSASQWDATKSAGNLVVSEVASQVGTQIAIRLGVSTGILATGVANSWWTVGAGLLIGLAVDFVWEWIDDPAGEIEKEMLNALDNLSIKTSTAIRDEMMVVVYKRKELWTKAVEGIVQ